MSLLNVFIKYMKGVQNAGIINVVNIKNDAIGWLKNYDLLYYSSTRYTMDITNTIGQTYKGVSTLNVVTDFHKMKTQEEKDQLFNHSFNSLGVKDTIRV